MSLILDALNRSREASGEVPGLETRHAGEPQRDNRFLIVLGVALLVALALIAWLLLDRAGTKPVTPEAPVQSRTAQTAEEAVPKPGGKVERENVAKASRPESAQETVQKPEPKPKPGPKLEPKPEPKPVPDTAPVQKPETAARAVADPAVAALYADKAGPAKQGQAVKAASTPKTAGQAEAPVVAEAPRVAEAPGVAEAPASKAPAAAEAKVEEALDIEKLMLQARDDLENATLSEHPAPFISGLSQQTKNAIPTIFYERHDYSGTPGKSAVVLNGKKLGKGGRTPGGVRVEEILPDSVVLDYKGTQFRLRALNSWVNL